jgi:uncharacterized protein YaaN involved in tellurite resistance
MSSSQVQLAPEKLNVPEEKQLREELSLMDPISPKAGSLVKPELEAKADEFVKMLLATKVSDESAASANRSAVEGFGMDLQKRAANQSAMLKNPIKKLSQRSDEGGDVGNALINLKLTVEDLDPGKFDFQPGWFARTVGMIPGIGTPMKRYFSKYESAQTVIDAIIRSLENGRDQLGRDNITLQEDQKRMRELTKKLEDGIIIAQLMDQKISYSLERDIPATDPKHKFIQEEIMFPLRQRTMDLQQQLAVNQQGVLAAEVIIRNNTELIRGVNRALNVTVTALEVAVTVALALADQQIVLDKVNALTSTTNNLISGTAARLKTQGAEIHKKASSTQLDMASLKSAFVDIQAAIDDLAKFRIEALPKMASTILEMDKLTTSAEAAIAKLEHGNMAKPTLNLDV